MKIKEGDVFAVPLSSNLFGVGQVLPHCWGFYNHFVSSIDDIDLDVLGSKEFFFKIWVAEFALKKRLWKIVGNRPIRQFDKGAVYFYKQDPITNQVWKTLTGGEEFKASIADCESLEIAAVWDPEHVVERLMNQFAGIPNGFIVYARNRLLDKGIPTA